MFSRASAVAVTTVAIAAALVWVQVAAGRPVERRSHSMVSGLRRGIAWHRSMTWRFQDQAGVARTPSRFVERRVRSVPFLRWVDQLWSHRRIAARRLAARAAGRIAHLALWLCIHRGEAGWHQPSYATDSHGVPLYWGGLQMHAGWGYGTSYHASDDPPAVQMLAAETGYRQSGYSLVWLQRQWGADSGCFGLA